MYLSTIASLFFSQILLLSILSGLRLCPLPPLPLCLSPSPLYLSRLLTFRPLTVVFKFGVGVVFDASKLISETRPLVAIPKIDPLLTLLHSLHFVFLSILNTHPLLPSPHRCSAFTLPKMVLATADQNQPCPRRCPGRRLSGAKRDGHRYPRRIRNGLCADSLNS